MKNRELQTQAILNTPALMTGFNESGMSEAQNQGNQNLWSLLDDRLRGRWLYSFLLGFILAGGCGAAGYFLTTPKFESSAMIRVVPRLSPILSETPETAPIYNYTMYMQTQAALIRSTRTIEEALRNPAVRQFPIARDPDAVKLIESGLSVSQGRGELINVTYAADEAAEAQAIVNAVVDSYHRLFGRMDDIDEKIRPLEARRGRLTGELTARRADLQALPSVRRYGTSSISTLFQSKWTELQRIRSEIAAWDLELAVLRSAVTPVGEDGVEITEASLTDAQLEALDPDIGRLRAEQQRLKSDLDRMSLRLGDQHRSLLAVQLELESVERRLAQAEDEARAMWSTRDRTGPVTPVGNVAGRDPEQIQRRLGLLREWEATLREELQLINSDLQRAQDLDMASQQIQRDIAEIEERLKSIRIEAERPQDGRIIVVSEGALPRNPSRDRRIRLGAMAAMAGFGSAFALFFVIGTLDRRAFRSAQIRLSTGQRCLGVLPDLGRSLDDPETSEMAAHCVHQIRNLIEAVRAPGESHVLTVSSPFQGDGKTSTALALGFSYATAGNRTLVLDCDLIGRGMTRQLGLVGHPGLKEALRHGRADGEITTTVTDDLYAMPVGVESSFGGEAVRTRDVAKLFAQLRQEFDMIIVDTGPILGSLESLPASSASDSVVLVMRRGRQRTRLEECLSYLESVGATCLGVILNCAARSDCNRYVSESSIEAEVTASRGRKQRKSEAQGLLVTAVRATRRSQDDGSADDDGRGT